MPRRTKVIAIALAVMLGVGGVLLFRKEAPSDADVAATNAAPTTTREIARAVAEKPAPASHLLGKIEPPAGGSDSSSTSAESNGFRLSSSPAVAGGYSSLGPLDGNGLAPGGDSSSPIARGTAFSEQRRHKVVDGDTLTALAQKYLGTSERFGEIYDLNRERLTSVDLLPIGAELRIPAAAPAGSAPAPDVSRQLVPVAPRDTSEGGAARTYRVKRNDTLTGIAREVYGDARRYRELWEANRGTLARPEDLREGTMLVIP